MSPYMRLTKSSNINFMHLFPEMLKLGEQDKMALICIHEFKDWNH